MSASAGISRKHKTLKAIEKNYLLNKSPNACATIALLNVCHTQASLADYQVGQRRRIREGHLSQYLLLTERSYRDRETPTNLFLLDESYIAHFV